MRLSAKPRVVIVIAVAATVVIAVGFWVIASNAFRQRTGLAIENETSSIWGFDIGSTYGRGHLDVAAGGVGTFDVAVGLIVPQSFNVTIILPNERPLFRGTLNPGTGCWSYFKWNGSVLQIQSYKVCT